jgi:DUF1680 family protein
VSWRQVKLTGGFWGERQHTNSHRTIPAIYKQMKDTGRIDAWKLDWQEGQPQPHIFWDSDSGKWIEAAAYSLATTPNPELEAQVDAVIDLIEQAQQPDGYLNIFYTAVEPENRLTNLRDRHEFYDAGHLVEGAVAYYEATGKRKLLDVLSRYIQFIDERFGPNEGQRHGYDGHPEVELALVRLYNATGEKRYLDLSKYFVDERGQQPHFFDMEAKERGDDPKNFWAQTYRYCQAHLPVREQTEACGHSVRAGYLYSGMADIAAETGDVELKRVCQQLWDDLTQHQMYVTGGLGPAHSNEGFTFAYDLPNETAYAETCAAISLIFWAQRMFLMDPSSRYIDVMERALYNGMIAGVSLEGTQFFYANPLASYPGVNPYDRWSGILTDRHYRRSDWFECACCPPNLARLVASIGGYFYTTAENALYVHLYNSNQADVSVAGQNVHLTQETSYPWDETVRLTVGVEQPASFELALRIPGWCRSYSVSVNGQAVTSESAEGYARIQRTWADGDTVTLRLAMPVERVAANPQVRQDAGQIALQRGPVVYCLEQADNGPRLANVIIPDTAQLSAVHQPDLFNGVTVITGEALRDEPRTWGADLYRPLSTTEFQQQSFTFQAIPYCFWANREPGEMRVWIRHS